MFQVQPRTNLPLSPPVSIRQRILEASLRKSPAAQKTGVALSTGGAVFFGIITAVSTRIVDSQGKSFPDNLFLRHVNERGMNLQYPFALCPGPGGQPGHFCKGLKLCRPAVRVAAIIQGIDPYENIICPNYFSPCHGVGQENGIAPRHIGRWDACFHCGKFPSFGHLAVA
jgi:hypothetical protein